MLGVNGLLVRVLGSAAGGGVPQWNCNCPVCQKVRAGGPSLYRTQSALAVSPDGQDWYLVNASPDVRQQILSCKWLEPGPGYRDTPLRGVILTDAELDHTLGLLSLREGDGWCLYATAAVHHQLTTRFPVLPVLHAYAPRVQYHEVVPGDAFTLGHGSAQIRVHATEVSRRLPLYAGEANAPGAVVALTFENIRTSRRLVYAPAVAAPSTALHRELASADCILFDGTFWSEEELVRLGISSRTAADMDHLPMAGPSGSARWLETLPARIKLYVHVNNTNPALDPAGPERHWIRSAGLDLAEDGWEIEL